MGMFSSPHGTANSSSTTNSSTWNASQIESMLNGFDPNIYYEDQQVMQLDPVMQKILGYEQSATPFENAQKVFGKGKGIMSNVVDEYKQMKGVTGDQVLSEWLGTASKVYDSAGNYINTMDKGIENQVYAQMGSTMAQNATTNMQGSTFTSGAANSAQAELTSGGQQMAAMESQVANSVLAASGHIATSGIRAKAGAKASEIGIEGKAATSLMGAGAKMGSNAMSNAWNAGLVNMGYQGYVNKTNRHNDMVNNNLDLADNMIWLEAMLQGSNVQTTSTTNGSTHY